MSTSGIQDSDWLIILGGLGLLVVYVVWSIIQGIMNTFGINFNQFNIGLIGAVVAFAAGGLWFVRKGKQWGIIGGVITAIATPPIGWIVLKHTEMAIRPSIAVGFGLVICAIYGVMYGGRVAASVLSIWLESRKDEQHQTNTPSSSNRRRRNTQSPPTSEAKRMRTRTRPQTKTEYRDRTRESDSRYR